MYSCKSELPSLHGGFFKITLPLGLIKKYIIHFYKTQDLPLIDYEHNVSFSWALDFLGHDEVIWESRQYYNIVTYLIVICSNRAFVRCILL